MKQVLFPSVLGFLVLAAAAPPVQADPSTQPPAIVDRDGSIRPSPNASPSNDTDATTPAKSGPGSVASGHPAIAQADPFTVAQNDNPVAQASLPLSPASSADPVTGALNFNPPGATVVAYASSPADTADAIVNPPSATPPSPRPAEGSRPNPAPSPAPSIAKPSASASPSVSSTNKDLFAGGSDSLVARVVGAAEGTRNPDGSPTSLYEGHKDPGNGVWNRGTFSYQFGNEENLSAEEADKRQVAKIKRIYESVLKPQAQEHGVAPLTLEEELNGLDLINQAPLAVTEDGGYIERLAEAKQKKGLSGEAAILEARVWSFWDGQKGGWDAPGLRAYDDMGKEASIRHDQDRRMGMIDKALDVYQQQNGAIAQNPPPAKPESDKVAVKPMSYEEKQPVAASTIADLIIYNRS